MANPNPNPNPDLSAYYQTRAAHHAVVTSDWLAQAQAAVAHLPGGTPPPEDLSGDTDKRPFSVIDEFNRWRKQPDLARPWRRSWPWRLTSALEYEDFNSAKARLIERGEKFGEISRKLKQLTVLDMIYCASLELAEGRPDRTGLRLSNELSKLNVPVKLLIDSAVAYAMDEVDMVFVGADGVVESGGIINMMGTYQIALVAHSMNKPVYVAAESYKFARLYPLDQKDMAPALRPIDFGVPIPPEVEVEKSARDYTPPQYLTLLFTDLGVLTPSVKLKPQMDIYMYRGDKGFCSVECRCRQIHLDEIEELEAATKEAVRAHRSRHCQSEGRPVQSSTTRWRGSIWVAV
ncbi:hypothetical protein Syun_026670 [Stephania yunnanensis]|uniref:FLZ-type domain-containing protein n=1 Tax=Stephania yunnanensis TaxID=152371 RepID=A0AAP0EU15_9MAGN